MELRKIRNIENRPLDYLKERNCRSSMQSRLDYGTSMIGWQTTKLKNNMPIKGSHKSSVKQFDYMKSNHFQSHNGDFTRNVDRKLKMKRGYPYHKLDITKQRLLVKNISKFAKKLSNLRDHLKLSGHHKSVTTAISPFKMHKYNNLTKLTKKSETERLSKHELKSSIKRIYDKIYDDKLRSHFGVPYPKFPYNLDKDTIHLEKPKTIRPSSTYKARTSTSSHHRLGTLISTINKDEIDFYRTNRAYYDPHIKVGFNSMLPSQKVKRRKASETTKYSGKRSLVVQEKLKEENDIKVKISLTFYMLLDLILV